MFVVKQLVIQDEDMWINMFVVELLDYIGREYVDKEIIMFSRFVILPWIYLVYRIQIQGNHPLLRFCIYLQIIYIQFTIPSGSKYYLYIYLQIIYIVHYRLVQSIIYIYLQIIYIQCTTVWFKVLFKYTYLKNLNSLNFLTSN